MCGNNQGNFYCHLLFTVNFFSQIEKTLCGYFVTYESIIIRNYIDLNDEIPLK